MKRFSICGSAGVAALSLACASLPAGQTAPVDAPVTLRVESVKFEPTDAHLRKQGYTHYVTIALGCSHKPSWWGTDAAPRWLVDVGLVYPQGQKYRRLRLKNGTTTPAGAMPSYNSLTGQYIALFTLHKADIQHRLGKVALTTEFVLSRQVGGVRFETVPDARFQGAKRAAVGSVPLWVLVPRVGARK